MQEKTNAELLQLILEATTELERRRVENESTEDEGEGDLDEGGDHPPTPKFP